MDIDRVSKAVVDRAIEQASARVRTVSALAGALLISAAAIGYVALAVFADHFIDGGLPLAGRRVALGAVGVLIAILTATYVIRPAFRRINQLYAAWLLERARPDLRHSVTTSLLLRGRSDVHVGVSSGLAFQAARAVRRIDISGVVSDRAIKRAGMAVGIVLATFCVYGVLAPKQVRPSVLRVLGADVPAPTRTSVDILSPGPEASVVVGTPVAFEVAVRGRLPDAAWLEFSHDEGANWAAGQRLELNRPVDPSADHPIWTATRAGADVSATVWYRVHAGDARCEARRLEVRPQPVAGDHVVEVTWPEYANRSGSTRTEGPIDALIGSRAELTVRTNVPASDGRVVFRDASGSFSRQMTIKSDDCRTLTAGWVVDRDLEYEVRFNDQHGAENLNPIRYTQRARGDQPPEIVQTDPPARFAASVADVFTVKARITDDWGLAGVVLDYRGTHGSGRIDLSGKSAAGRTAININRSISVESLGAMEGDVVELHLEASDTRLNLRGKPDPQVTRGPVCELRVTGGKGGGSSKDGGRKGGSGPVPGGNQLAGKGNEGEKGGASGRDGKGDASGGKGKGNQPDEGAIARANSDGPAGSGGKEEDSKQSGQSNDASQPGQPGGETSQFDSGKSDGKGDPAKATDPAGAAKDNPAEGGKPESGDPGESTEATDATGKRGKSDGKGGKESGGAQDAPTDAAGELDRLIKDNKAALDKLGKRDESQPAEKSGRQNGDQSKPEGDSKSADGAKPSEPGKSANPQDSAKKKDEAGKSANAQPGKERKEPGSDASKGAGQQPEDKSEPKSNDAEKPSKSQSSKGDSKTEKKGESGEPAKSEDPSGDQSKPSEGSEQAQSGSKESPSDKEGDTADGKSDGGSSEKKTAGDSGPKSNESSKDAGKPANPGDAGSGQGDDAAKGEPTEEKSDGQPKSVTSEKQTHDNNSAKPGSQEATTPKPAQGVGPTPKSGGAGVTPDEGPSEVDGQFDGKGGADPLGAPMRERARRAVDELEQRLRVGGVSDAELRDLGWSRAEAQSFVTRYRRLQTAAQRQRDGGLFTGRIGQTGDETKAAGADSATGVGRGVAGAVRSNDGVVKKADRLREGPAESVPAELQDVLDEYYRSMARQSEPKAKSDKQK